VEIYLWEKDVNKKKNILFQYNMSLATDKSVIIEARLSELKEKLDALKQEEKEKQITSHQLEKEYEKLQIQKEYNVAQKELQGTTTHFDSLRSR
jgi:FtsZ-binding cell division protein ZapB